LFSNFFMNFQLFDFQLRLSFNAGTNDLPSVG
jgi:hypothetical protein